jgi:hypothetical protein
MMKKVPKPHFHLSLPKKAAASANLSGERDKISRMLGVLENEKREGITTEHAYMEMKKSLEEKLQAINKKLGKK